RMTRDLSTSSASLRAANLDLDQRRKYMETILRNVSAGVVSIDRNGAITTINRAAERMLGIKTDKVLFRKYEEVLKGEYLEMALPFLKELNDGGLDSLEKQLQITVKDRIMTVLVAMTVLRDDDLNYVGLVVVFEDLTELQKAERAAAWREIARRMAHEIKNPLTPIQLCAERLQRRYGESVAEADRDVFSECTKTIINQVAALKNLVNEFSRFARMPVTHPEPNDLNGVIRETLALYQDSHKGVAFRFHEDESLPVFSFDGEQIRRIMVNLLDNAVEAIQSSRREGTVAVKTSLVAEEDKVLVEVSDDGPGISPADRLRVFEPYFSTKKSGTGLGLAIVDSIIRDHGGTVTVRDNPLKGMTIAFKLPIPENIARAEA
ncbi:MAG TPA: ATP-binding protein, partial [Syntrophales bacterium]|nr:ATP-binding protein [Syntrophales bacterium]